jgi:hypothetical protein
MNALTSFASMNAFLPGQLVSNIAPLVNGVAALDESLFYRRHV